MQTIFDLDIFQYEETGQVLSDDDLVLIQPLDTNTRAVDIKMLKLYLTDNLLDPKATIREWLGTDEINTVGSIIKGFYSTEVEKMLPTIRWGIDNVLPIYQRELVFNPDNNKLYVAIHSTNDYPSEEEAMANPTFTCYKRTEKVEYSYYIKNSSGNFIRKESHPFDTPDKEILSYKNYTPPFTDEWFWADLTKTVNFPLWQEGHEYLVGDVVRFEDLVYICVYKHLSSNFSEDYTLTGYWSPIGNGNGSGAGTILEFIPRQFYFKNQFVTYEGNLYQRKVSGRDLSWTPENWHLLTYDNISTVFIKYSHLMPIQDSDMKDTPDDYIGISYGNFATPPVHWETYNWYKIKGADGVINLEADALVITYTLDAENWDQDDNGLYTKTINIGSFPANSNEAKIMNLITPLTRPLIDIELSDVPGSWKNEVASYHRLVKVETRMKSIIFYCKTLPETNFAVKIRINGDIREDKLVSKTEFEQYKEEMQEEHRSILQQFNELKAFITELNEDLENTLGGY